MSPDDEYIIAAVSAVGALGMVLLLAVCWVIRRRRKNRLARGRGNSPPSSGAGGGGICGGCCESDDERLIHDNHHSSGGSTPYGNAGGNQPPVSRQQSQLTAESGGDLADYLQNLVDGMERGAAPRQGTTTAATGAPQPHQRKATKVTNTAATRKASQRAAFPPPQLGEGGGVESSLLTIQPSSHHVDGRGGAGVSSPTQAALGDPLRPAGSGAHHPPPRAGGAAAAADYDEGNTEDTAALPPEKLSTIQSWQDCVYRDSQNEDLDDPSRHLRSSSMFDDDVV